MSEFLETQVLEIRDLGDEYYMTLAIDLANWRSSDDNFPDAANVAWSRLTSDTSQPTLRWARLRADRSIPVNPRALEFGQQLRLHFQRFLESDHKAIKAMRAIANTAVEEIRTATQLRVSERGALVHMHSYNAGDGDGPLGLTLAFLLDPDRRFARDLRRCRWADCGRFFFAPLGRKGGRLPSFCPDSDHGRQFHANRAAQRRKELRTKRTAGKKK